MPKTLIKSLPLLAALALSACLSPREQCEKDATANIRGLELAIANAQANIDRGYAIRQEDDTRFTYGLCNRSGNFQMCLKDEVRTKDVPVAIDLDEERRKLASAKKRLEQEKRLASSRVAQCQAQYPA